jgi:hypothetical protein
VILRISEDGKDEMPFPLPKDLGNSGEWHYSVDQGGGVYILYSKAETHVLSHLSSSGGLLNRTTLQLPRYFHTHSFAVLPDQTTMFLGSMPISETDVNSKSTRLSIWLGQNGKLVRTVQSGQQFSPMDFMDGLVVAGESDTFIEAINSEIRVFSPQGDLLKTFSIVKPTADSFATNLQLVDETIAVAFSHAVDAAPQIVAAPQIAAVPKVLEEIWLLVNASNGDAEGFYKMPHNFVGSTLCYLGELRFLNITVQNGRNLFVEASQ